MCWGEEEEVKEGRKRRRKSTWDASAPSRDCQCPQRWSTYPE